MGIDELIQRHAKELRIASAARVPTGPMGRRRPHGWAIALGAFATAMLLIAPVALLLRNDSGGSPGTGMSPPTMTTPLTASSSSTDSTESGQTSQPASVVEVRIEGTREPYTQEEARSFGEFDPLVWSLVTTLNGTNDIPHGPHYEWVTWGPLWSGRLPIPGPPDVYGVTSISAIDPEAIAAVVPAGTTLILREVRWSLDELNEFKDRINDAAPQNGVCVTSFGAAVNRIQVVATVAEPDLRGVPLDAVAIEVVDACPPYVPAGGLIP